MKSGFSLQKKSIAIVGGILLLVLAINTAVLTYIASNKYEGAMLSKLTAIGEGLQRELGKALSLGVPVESLDGVNEKMADLVTRDKAIANAMIIDLKGKVLFHNDQVSIGKTMMDKATQTAIASTGQMVMAAGSLYNISFPLLNAENKTTAVMIVGIHRAAIKSQLYTLLFWAMGISSLCFLLSLGLVYVSISKFITTPIELIEKAADRMASGDLTYVINIEGNDELASLGKAVNRMAMNLKDVITKIGGITDSVSGVTLDIVSLSNAVVSAVDVQKKALEDTAATIEDINSSISRVASSAGNLSESAFDSSSSVVEMTASIESVSETAGIFTENAHDTASSIEEMMSTIKQIAASIENLSSSAEAIASSINEVHATTIDIEQRANDSVGLAETVMNNASDKGMIAARAAIDGIENIKKSMAALSDVINMLGKRTLDIGKILNVIDDVADQTNLLALNAAILASKAGEHGKGFTIVADEIKSLAERASVSTGEIAALIRSFQDVTKSSIQMAHDGIQTVDKGLQLVMDVNGALNDIVESSRESTEMARAIQRATTEEVVVIKQITNAVSGMTEQTENISRAIQEQSRGSRIIVEAAERVKDLSSQVKTTTSDQKDRSRQISHIIENVSDQASRIADATGKQQEKSSEIIKTMEKILGTTGNLIQTSNEMNEVINSLRDEATNLLSEVQKFKV